MWLVAGSKTSCNIGVKETGNEDRLKLNAVCSTHSNLLLDKSIYTISLTATRRDRLQVTEAILSPNNIFLSCAVGLQLVWSVTVLESNKFSMPTACGAADHNQHISHLV